MTALMRARRSEELPITALRSTQCEGTHRVIMHFLVMKRTLFLLPPLLMNAPCQSMRAGVTVARRQEISVFELSSVVAELQSENSLLRVQ